MKLILAVAVACLGTQAWAVKETNTINSRDEVVYGDDNRRDVAEYHDPRFRDLAMSTAGMVPVNKLRLDQTTGRYNHSGVSVGVEMNLCADQRYGQQKAIALCSGFLVAPNVLVTAGHCIQNSSDCNEMAWVFGYTGQETLHQNQVYRCTGIKKQALENHSGLDFAVITLDRNVVGTKPLQVRRSGEAAIGEKLVVIGHPTGMPLKIADGATVRANSNANFFVADLDTFQGNSGSPVFNATSGFVEGILVRGEQDYERSPQGCTVVKKCAQTACRGEDVTKISAVIRATQLNR